ncbi:hypothetical protein PUNSTDRAFT_143867 [Punctularia strigosozonata HHB-11173 SS5]|uniref:uncharacterized protein n=1 Tax=Punctularia strigosozonata (strain HHB-11173) TaxID=741275 RepID=UPI00044169CF|nr:uncharacterized protein PUNSTDRAFT_143867 [Punctularia strigosozonata HHB-11173 SS5]EIN08211.1 hypothetical protein PUNSTDRAFT_143867 [Punctularia strigosozonata HHB-11173 SS5]
MASAFEGSSSYPIVISDDENEVSTDAVHSTSAASKSDVPIADPHTMQNAGIKRKRDVEIHAEGSTSAERPTSRKHDLQVQKRARNAEISPQHSEERPPSPNETNTRRPSQQDLHNSQDRVADPGAGVNSHLSSGPPAHPTSSITQTGLSEYTARPGGTTINGTHGSNSAGSRALLPNPLTPNAPLISGHTPPAEGNSMGAASFVHQQAVSLSQTDTAFMGGIAGSFFPLLPLPFAFPPSSGPSVAELQMQTALQHPLVQEALVRGFHMALEAMNLAGFQEAARIFAGSLPFNPGFEVPGPLVQEPGPSIPPHQPAASDVHSPISGHDTAVPSGPKVKLKKAMLSIGLPTVADTDDGLFQPIHGTYGYDRGGKTRTQRYHPDPSRTLVMEAIPKKVRNIKFLRWWVRHAVHFGLYNIEHPDEPKSLPEYPTSARRVEEVLPWHMELNDRGKALLEFPTRETAQAAFSSPRMTGNDGKTGIRVRWYAPPPDKWVHQAPPAVPASLLTLGDAKGKDVASGSLAQELTLLEPPAAPRQDVGHPAPAIGHPMDTDELEEGEIDEPSSTTAVADKTTLAKAKKALKRQRQREQKLQKKLDEATAQAQNGHSLPEAIQDGVGVGPTPERGQSVQRGSGQDVATLISPATADGALSVASHASHRGGVFSISTPVSSSYPHPPGSATNPPPLGAPGHRPPTLTHSPTHSSTGSTSGAPARDVSYTDLATSSMASPELFGSSAKVVAQDIGEDMNIDPADAQSIASSRGVSPVLDTSGDPAGATYEMEIETQAPPLNLPANTGVRPPSTSSHTPPSAPRAMKNIPKGPTFLRRMMQTEQATGGGIPSPSPDTSTPSSIVPSTTADARAHMEDNLRRLVLESKKARLLQTQTASPPGLRPTNEESAAEQPLTEADTKLPSELSANSMDILATTFISETIQTLQKPGMSGAMNDPRQGSPAAKSTLPRPSSALTSELSELANKQKQLEQHIAETKQLMAQLGAARTKEEKDKILAVLRQRSRAMDALSSSAAPARSSTPTPTSSTSSAFKPFCPEPTADSGIIMVSDDED